MKKYSADCYKYLIPETWDDIKKILLKVTMVEIDNEEVVPLSRYDNGGDSNGLPFTTSTIDQAVENLKTSNFQIREISAKIDINTNETILIVQNPDDE